MLNEKRDLKKIELTFRILKTVALAGIIASVVLLPGLAAAIAPFVREKGKTKKGQVARVRVNTAIWRLKQRGLLKDFKGKLSLTPKGRTLLTRYQLKELTIKKPKKWDGKWRVIAFDVWESRRAVRNLLRKTLQNLGFVKLQSSLWVYPYDCEEIIGLLRTDLKLSPAIQYIVAERIDRDQHLRKYFDLSWK